jgi:hypothetical protein
MSVKALIFACVDDRLQNDIVRSVLASSSFAERREDKQDDFNFVRVF